MKEFYRSYYFAEYYMGCNVNVCAIANSHSRFDICVWFDGVFFSKNDYEFTEKEEKNRHIPIL